MNRGLYANATSMMAAQQWMDTVSNNLANASTNGFKRDAVGFDEALLRQMNLGRRSLGELGAGPVIGREYTLFERGAIQETHNPLDLAITEAHGLFAVRVGNETRYTRDGSFTLNPNRQLVTQEGYPVLDPQGQPITLPEGSPIAIREDGNIQVNGQEAGQVGVFDVDRTDPLDAGFRKIGTNLFVNLRPVKAVDGSLRQGTIESSNVDAVASMVDMIRLSRAFEMAQRSMTSQDELNQRLIQSLSDR